MKILALSLCLFIIASVCAAEETDYFDWKGGKLVAAKNYTGALIYFDKAINQDPNFINAYVHKGDMQRTQKDYNASLESYTEALQRDNKTKAAWSGMIQDYVALNDYPKASDAAAKITEIEPKTKENWLTLGNLLQMQGLYDAAAKKYSSALDIANAPGAFGNEVEAQSVRSSQRRRTGIFRASDAADFDLER